MTLKHSLTTGILPHQTKEQKRRWEPGLSGTHPFYTLFSEGSAGTMCVPKTFSRRILLLEGDGVSLSGGWTTMYPATYGDPGWEAFCKAQCSAYRTVVLLL